MCLYVNEVEESKFVKKYNKTPGAKVKVYKILKFYEGDIITPYQDVTVEPGWFNADVERPSLFENVKNNTLNSYNEEIHYGIHAYKDLQEAKDELSLGDGEFITECYMYAKDVVGIGDDHIVANKMFIPAKDINKVLNKKRFGDTKVGQKFQFVNHDEYDSKTKYMKVEGEYGDSLILDLESFTVTKPDAEDMTEVKFIS